MEGRVLLEGIVQAEVEPEVDFEVNSDDEKEGCYSCCCRK